MNIGRYLRDTYLYLLMAAAVLVVIYLFLSVFNIPPNAILFVMILIALLLTSIFMREYFKRKKYYTTLLELFDKLDKKFLISELMEEGSFADSAIFYDIMRRANKSMNDEVARYKLQAQDYADFLESWVHEIKTPIASARLTIENNRNNVTESIEEDLNRIENYVQSTLYYARSSIVEKDFLIKKVTLDTLVKQALRENSKLLIGHKIAVSMEGLDAYAFTDPKWVLFILGQLVANSVKYAQAQQAQLCFIGKETAQGTVLQIRDNGIGISLADLPRVFEKGFTGQHGRTYAKSTGMGLYLCKKLCDKLGINITASSENGTCITLVFPKTDMFFTAN